MADPLSMTASLLAIATAAIQSAKSLNETVKRYRDRDKTLRRLQDELSDLTKILESLTKANDAEQSVVTLLEGPIKRCTQICHEFELSMKSFSMKSKASLLDWAKMEFMKGDINEFIETIAGYKSTISVGLGTITIHASSVSHKVLLEYNEMIKDTTYNLELHLQRIDDKMTQLTMNRHAAPNVSVDLNDERDVTRQCLQVCEQARSHLQDLSNGASFLYEAPRSSGQDQLYEAQIRMRQTLDETRDSFAKTSSHLFRRLDALIQDRDTNGDEDRLRLQSDIEVSKQCLDLCNLATEISRQKIYRVGEAIADGDSDQMVVNTLADLFDVEKAVAKDNSAQLIGSMSPDELRHVTDARYKSRFGALTTEDRIANSQSSSQDPKMEQSSSKGGDHEQPVGPKSRQGKPSSNEMRKRTSVEDATRRSATGDWLTSS